MANPQLKTADKLTVNDFILIQLREIKEGQRDLRQEIKEVRAEIKDVRQEMNSRLDKLEDKIEDVRKETKSAMRQSQIMAGTCVTIGLGVIYFILTH